MVQHKGKKKAIIISRIFFIIIGGILTALGLEAVLIPHNVIDGGITGISMMFSEITNIGLGIFLFILNFPFIWVGYKQVGKTFALSSALGIVVLSISTSLMHHITPFPIDDLLLVTIFGGIMIGIGIGIVLRNGGALDGTEVLAVLISKKVPFSLGEIIMVFNVIIFSAAIAIFGLSNALYSALTYFIASRVIDMVQVGFEGSKSAVIISGKYKEVGDAIQARLGRSITYMAGKGGYSEEKTGVIYCVINRLEESKLKDIINDVDDSAFVTISDVSEVKGGRFKKKDIH